MQFERNPQILIADDDEDWRRILSDSLESEGYDIQFASTYKEALAMLRGSAFFDIICMNVVLRGEVIPGWKLEWTNLMAEARRKATSVIVITAMNKAESPIEIHKEAKDNGVNAVLFKENLSRNQLLKKIGEIISKKKMSESQFKIYTPEVNVFTAYNKKNEKSLPTITSNLEIFISYSWVNKSEVDKIDIAFQQQGIILVRDERDLHYKADIKAFMERIGRGNFVILVISDNYLKSRNCMYETLELLKNPDFKDRVYPIVLPDASKIYDAVQAIEYIQYWDTKSIELNNTLKSLSNVAYAGRIYEEINHAAKIRNSIDEFIRTIQNLNNLTFEIHRKENFSSIIRTMISKI